MEQTLGKRIVHHRKKLGLTQDQLAEQLGVTAQAVSKWENDQSCPDITMLPKLAAIFGITTDALLGSTPAEPVTATHVTVEDAWDDDDDDDDDEDKDHKDDEESGKKPSKQEGEVETTAPTEPAPVVTYEYRFEVVKGDYTWYEAKAEAERRGGYLATISSPEEYEKICREANNSGLIYLWMGANLPEGTTAWRWSDGTPIPLDNYYWYRSGSIVEPSYIDKADNTREDCLCLWKLSTGSYEWTLNDQRNDLSGLVPADKIGFVIEYKVEVTR